MTGRVQHRGQCLLAMPDLLVPLGHSSWNDLCFPQMGAHPSEVMGDPGPKARERGGTSVCCPALKHENRELVTVKA